MGVAHSRQLLIGRNPASAGWVISIFSPFSRNYQIYLIHNYTEKQPTISKRTHKSDNFVFTVSLTPDLRHSTVRSRLFISFLHLSACLFTALRSALQLSLCSHWEVKWGMLEICWLTMKASCSHRSSHSWVELAARARRFPSSTSLFRHLNQTCSKSPCKGKRATKGLCLPNMGLLQPLIRCH